MVRFSITFCTCFKILCSFKWHKIFQDMIHTLSISHLISVMLWTSDPLSISSHIFSAPGTWPMSVTGHDWQSPDWVRTKQQSILGAKCSTYSAPKENWTLSLGSLPSWDKRLLGHTDLHSNLIHLGFHSSLPSPVTPMQGLVMALKFLLLLHFFHLLLAKQLCLKPSL